MNLSTKMLTNYRYMTEINAHGELLETVAKDFNLMIYVNLFKAINNIHSVEGHLNYDVLQVRDRLKLEMMEILKRKINDLDYEEMKSIF